MATAEFSKFAGIMSALTVSSFRIWNSSTGISSPLLALFVVMLPRPTWLHIPGCLALGEWSHHCGYLVHEDLFCIVLMCILATSSWYLLLLLGPYHFCPLKWNECPMQCSLGISNFLEVSSLSHSIVFLYFLHCSLTKPFSSLLAVLWNFAFSWVYLTLSPLTFISLLSYL